VIYYLGDIRPTKLSAFDSQSQGAVSSVSFLLRIIF